MMGRSCFFPFNVGYFFKIHEFIFLLHKIHHLKILAGGEAPI